MEVEAFPIRFTRGVRAHWRRRKYQRLEAGDCCGRTSTTRRLGGPRRLSGVWGVRLRGVLRRVRVVGAAPARALRRLRDAYVGGMLAVASKASAMALPNGAEGLWTRRVPQRNQKLQRLPAAAGAPARPGQPTEFEQRLILEIYKSIVASKELTTMLHSSTAHLQTSSTYS